MMSSNGIITRVGGDEAAARAAARRRAADERRAQIAELCPKVHELERQINELAIDFSDKIMRSPADAAALSSLAADMISAKRAEMARLLAEKGLPEDYLSAPYFCEACRDTGYVNGSLCGCMRQAVVNECFSGSGINPDESFETFRFDLLKDKKQSSAIKKINEYCRKYADSFPDNEQESILLFGPPGVGKTFLLNCIGGRVLSNGHSVLKITANRLIQTVMDSLKGGAEERPDFNIPELLIIDDLGTEPMINNVTIETLLSIICERQDAHRPLLIATNLDTQKLAQYYGARIASRLLAPKTVKAILIDTDNVRLTK